MLPALYPLGKALNLKGGENNNGMPTSLQAEGVIVFVGQLLRGQREMGRVCPLRWTEAGWRTEMGGEVRSCTGLYLLIALGSI